MGKLFLSPRFVLLADMITVRLTRHPQALAEVIYLAERLPSEIPFQIFVLFMLCPLAVLWRKKGKGILSTLAHWTGSSPFRNSTEGTWWISKEE